MTPENLNIDEITEARRKAIAESIRPISVEELKVLCEGFFPLIDHPWEKVFFDFITENAGSTFHHAVTHDQIQIIYCHAKEKGIWFLSSGGKGPLQPQGLAILKEIVEGL